MKSTIIKRIGLLLLFVAAILCTTAFTFQRGSITGVSTVAFCFLIIVLLSAYFGDIVIAIVTSLVATLCFDYFYLPPIGTFHITAFSDWVSLTAFLLASLAISRLTALAAGNASRAAMLNDTMTRLKLFGEWLMRQPQDQLTLTGMAQEALRLFSLEYCSIHVYVDGKWSHVSGMASSSAISQHIESKLNDHPSDFMELADENVLGVRYMEIGEGSARKALLAVKSDALPHDAIGAIAYMIGLRLPDLRSVLEGEKKGRQP